MKSQVIIIFMFFCFAANAIAEVKTYRFNDMFTLSVSDILELRKESDIYTRFLNDTLYYFANSDIVFQQKGLSNKETSALAKYCRIMIVTDYDESCPYPCSDEDEFSDTDIKGLIDACKEELSPNMRFIQEPTYTIKTTTSGNKYILVHYIRSGDKGDVRVNICYFFNYKYVVKAVFSYRISESNIWQSSIDSSINSFSWSEPYIAYEYTLNDIGNDTVATSDNSYNVHTGIFIGVLFMLVFGGFVYCVKSYNKKKYTRHIEYELLRLNELISENKIVSASNALNSIKKEDDKIISNYGTIIKDAEDKIQCAYNVLNKSVDDILARIGENLIDEGATELNTPEANEISDNQEVPTSIKEKLDQGISYIEEQYCQGIIPNQKEFYTQYELPPCSQFNSYSFYSAPSKGTIVFPYRRRKVELRGYTEKQFEEKLKLSLTYNTNYQVLGDVSILTVEGCHPYEPDISIVEKENKYGIRIDIEIDEPYSGLEKNPIHFIGCGDEFRDKNLANHGWIVIRFSEKQIHNEPSKCINYIKYILCLVDNDVIYSDVFPTPDKKWTEIEATIMAIRRYRESLLHHEFGRMEKETSRQIISQTEEEKSAAYQVKPLILPSVKQANIDKSSQTFHQDSKISFEPKEHIYLYNGLRSLTPVSTVISNFFESFDSIGLSERVAYREGKRQCEVLEEWDCNGIESREIGTFLHSQIESFFLGKPMSDHTMFSYHGEYINIERDVSINDEINYFKNFLRDNTIKPFRTEWHIFDLELRMAGTIDLLCRNGNMFDMYDWKRSRKASPDEIVWKNGINGLNHIPDISFYRYAIQQNLYRYILEKNYGITINKMNIVVFHSMYDDYRKFEIPRMDKELKIIANYLRLTN